MPVAKKFIGKHTCETPFLIYRTENELWDYICPVCMFPIDQRQAKEDSKPNTKIQKFEGRLN